MDPQFRRLISQLDRIEGRRAAMANKLPDWAEDHQGGLMARVMLQHLGTRVSQANNPDWFDPSELTTEATREMGKLALSMLKTTSYADAYAVAQAELAKWPRYRYPHQVTTAMETKS
jgi:hypothetical protein